MEEDRISQLPDEILLQILSFTDIHEAIQTSILSRRWKNLWHSLSDLHFHLTRFAAHTHSPLNNYKAAQATSHHFSDFISHFLSHSDNATSIRSFLLSFDSLFVRTSAPFIEKCVYYALHHGVQSLSLRLRTYYYHHEPILFASESLQELELTQIKNTAYFPSCFSFPHLKTLCLQGYYFTSHIDTDLKEPFSGFPELEKLTLRHCSCIVSRIVVKAPSLRFLEIIDDTESVNLHQERRMGEISAPLLTCFRYEGLCAFECLKVDFPMLEEVYFDVYRRVNVRGMDLRCVSMLHQFGNATTVVLTLDTLEVIKSDGDFIEQSPSPFPNMKRLKLIKGRWDISTVLQCVMSYLTVKTLHCDSFTMEVPHGVDVVEHNLSDSDDGGADLLQLLQRMFE